MSPPTLAPSNMTHLQALFTPQCIPRDKQTTEPTTHLSDEEALILILFLALLAWEILPVLLEVVVRIFSSTSTATSTKEEMGDIDAQVLPMDKGGLRGEDRGKGDSAAIMQRHYGVPSTLDQVQAWERKKMLER